MGRIQSGVGLISGIPVQDTIDKLLSLAARPRVVLEGRVALLKAQKLAVAEVTALVIGVQFAIQRLGTSEIFAKTNVTTTDDTVLAAAASGNPAVGTYQFTPVRRAQSHQLLSQGFASKSSTLGAGELSVQFGGFVDKGMRLEDLNAGQGVSRGKLRITDRAGDSAIIDLRLATTIDDVLRAINESDTIQVAADVDGDRIRLRDTSGQSIANLRVQEVGSTTTAADLGLAGINVAANEATGDDVLQLFDNLQLQQLNDGNGVNLRRSVADLRVGLHDGTSLDIDFLGLKKGDTESSGTTNAKQGVNAQIKITSTGVGESFDGYRLVFVDDPSVTSGNEKVDFDAGSKLITVKIDAGETRAAEVIAKLNAHTQFSANFTAANGTGGNGTGIVDVADTLSTSGGAPEYYHETTLVDLLDTINRADPAKLLARVSATGDNIELVDLTSGGGTFSVSDLLGGTLASDLGFTSAAVGNVITSDRRLSGLKTVSLGSLAGGYGLGTLGVVSLTNRSGATTNVDLAAASTLEDVIESINAANAGITARVNDARNGLLLTDTTTGTGNLIVANGDATNSADKLRITANVAKSAVNGGSLGLQTFNANLSLASLRNGRGIGSGSFLITDSNGQFGAVNLTVLDAQTVGDLIDGINSLGIGVSARINDSGDGLLLVDTAGGSGQLSVSDVGSGTAAKDLKIAGTAVVKTIGGVPTQVLDGSYTTRVMLDADDTLQDLVTRLNAAQGDFTASLLNSGGGSAPFRIAINGQITGQAGQLLVDGSGLGINFQVTAAAQDAMLLSGSLDAPVIGALISSPTNEFAEVIEDVRLTIHNTSEQVQTVTIDKTADNIVEQVKLFADQYNKLRDKIKEVASYNPEENRRGVLFASGEILQIDLAFGDVLTSRFFSTGAIQSFEEIGLSLDEQGTLDFNEQKFRDKYAADAAGIEKFFTTTSSGGAARFVAAAERLSGRDRSILINRANALQRTIDNHQRQITIINSSLERQRERMVKQFAQLEVVVAKMQSNLSWLSRIQPLPFPTQKS